MLIKVKKKENYVVVKILNYEIDSKTLNTLRSTLRNLLNHGETKIIIDMSKVININNKFLGCLLAFRKKFGLIGGEISICEVKHDLLSIFYIIKFDNYFNIYNTENDILFNKSPLIKRRFKIV